MCLSLVEFIPIEAYSAESHGTNSLIFSLGRNFLSFRVIGSVSMFFFISDCFYVEGGRKSSLRPTTQKNQFLLGLLCSIMSILYFTGWGDGAGAELGNKDGLGG